MFPSLKNARWLFIMLTILCKSASKNLEGGVEKDLQMREIVDVYKRGQGIEVLPKNMFDSTFLFNKDSYYENFDGDANL